MQIHDYGLFELEWAMPGQGVAWPTAHAAFVAHAEAVLGDPAPVSVLGIDETHRGKPRWIRDEVSGRWVRTDPWDTGFVELTGDQGLLGQVEGRCPGGSALPGAPMLTPGSSRLGIPTIQGFHGSACATPDPKAKAVAANPAATRAHAPVLTNFFIEPAGSSSRCLPAVSPTRKRWRCRRRGR